MAIDKAIDSAALDANLTTVADAIRAKGGTTDPLSFPTGFADAIAAIQAGGGAKVAVGEFIPAAQTALSTSAPLSIEHGLGVNPTFAIVARSEAPTGNNTFWYGAYMSSANGYSVKQMKFSVSTGSSTSTLSSRPSGRGTKTNIGMEADETHFHIYGSSSCSMGVATYYWIVGVI